MNIAVIGSGIGGLAAAVRLSLKGHQVTVFEKNIGPGGKISSFSEKGYRFDTGPSLFTLPELLDELFVLAGEKPSDWIEYERLDVTCNYFFPGGKVLRAFSDREKFKEECNKVLGEPTKNIDKHLDNAAELYRITAGIFIFRSLHKFRNYFRKEVCKSFMRLGRLKFYKTMHQVNRKTFQTSELVQLFDRYATYNGSDPYRAPATLNVIAHLENNMGAFFPNKGMYSIVDSIYRLALKTGVEFRFNTLVEEIILKNKKASAIRTGDKIYDFDLIVAGTDVKYLAEYMMDHPLKKRISRTESSSSALIFYWGVKGDFPGLDLHNIFFSGNYPREFKTIFKTGEMDPDPTIYLFISAKRVISDAPPGCGNWFVMINASAGTASDRDELVRAARQTVIRKLNQFLNTDLEKFIECEQVITPADLEKRTLSRHGALYGASSNSVFSAFLRHPNFLPSVDNLFFTGGSVHPGGGIPLCLASAMIVENEITRVIKKQSARPEKKMMISRKKPGKI